MNKKLFSALLAVLMIFSAAIPAVSAADTYGVSALGEEASDVRVRLDALLAQAVSIMQSSDLSSYPADACERLEGAMSEAYGVYYNPNATYEELLASAQKLEKAIDDMQKSGVSENALYYLSSAITAAEVQVGSELDYTAESYKIYEEALANAKRVQTQAKTDEEVIEAAQALNNAVSALVPVSDAVSSAREYLRYIINNAYKVLGSDERYTAESLALLEAAIESGNAMYYNTSATAAELYYEADKITSTINYMDVIEIPQGVVDYLSGVIAMADTTVGEEADYTADSWRVYAEAYSQAVRVLQNGETEEEYTAAANALAAAISALVPVDAGVAAAKDYLVTVMDSAHQILNSTVKYSSESVARLESAVDSANDVLVDETATEQEVYEKAEEILNAIELMVEITVSDEVRGYLIQVIAKADDEVGSAQEYTADTWSVYEQAYSQAVRILSESDREDEFISAANALGAAIEGLVSIEQERLEASEYLLEVISAAQQMLENGVRYTAQTSRNLKDAIDSAKAVSSNEKALVQDFYDEADKLQEAMFNLVEVVISDEATACLTDAVAKADAQVGAEDEYTPESWSAYKTAYTEAIRVLAEGESDEEFIMAADALCTAMENLVPEENDDNNDNDEEELQALRTELGLLIDSAKAIKGNFTQESMNILAQTVAKSEEVYNDETADADLLREQIDSLSDAIDGLEEITVTPSVKEELANAIASADEIFAADNIYTQESVQALTVAYNNAKNVYSAAISDDELTDATEKLIAAIKGLVPADSAPDEVFVLLGDVDADGKVTIKDATFIQKSIAGIVSLEGLSRFAADANRDGTVNVKDATEIQKHLASLKACEEIGREIAVVTPG